MTVTVYYDIPYNYRDGISNIKRRVYEIWQDIWREERRNIYLLKPVTGYCSEHIKLRTRDEEVVINRVRLGHTPLTITHGHIFHPELQRSRPP